VPGSVDALAGSVKGPRYGQVAENKRQSCARRLDRGWNTRWRRRRQRRVRLTWERREPAIADAARTDGLFPLLTNDATLTAAEILDAYKRKQPPVEKRHDLLKNVEAATPMELKSISRIAALLALHFVALLVHALLEREVRRAMARRGSPSSRSIPRIATAPASGGGNVGRDLREVGLSVLVRNRARARESRVGSTSPVWSTRSWTDVAS
jgi:hypothetical protein